MFISENKLYSKDTESPQINNENNAIQSNAIRTFYKTSQADSKVHMEEKAQKDN